MSETRSVPIDLIVEPPEPMRVGFDENALNELADDIRKRGLLQFPVLYPEMVCEICSPSMCAYAQHQKNAPTGRFVIAAGHRRYLACRICGFKEIMCTIREGTPDDYEGDMVAENMFRENLTPFEEGNRFKEISVRDGMTEQRLKRLCGNKSLPYIYSRIRLLEGDPDIALAVHGGKITLGVAQELNKVSTAWHRMKERKYTDEQWAEVADRTEGHRKYLLQLACDTGTTTAQAKSWVLQWEQLEGIAPPPPVVVSSPAPQTMVPGFIPCCAMCGQNHRPYDLENVYICRSELIILKGAYATGQQATES